MKEFRAYLWDIFVYLGIGAFMATLGVINYLLVAPKPVAALVQILDKTPVSLLIFLVPGSMMLLGALIEPPANQFEKSILWIHKVFQCRKPRIPPSNNGQVLERYIKRHFTNELLGGEESPFSLCRDYVENRDMSTTFMPFLSKFGFYRSAAFCLVVFTVLLISQSIYYSDGRFNLICGALLSCILACSYFYRSAQFYSYQAPAVYQAFIGPILEKLVKDFDPKSESDQRTATDPTTISTPT